MDSLIRQQQDHFNKIAQQYYMARKNPKLELLKKIIWKTAFQTQQTWALRESLDVLEAMCGFADGYEILRDNLESEFSYSGFDYSEAMVNYARKTYPKIKFFLEDITNYTSEEQYDLIILIGGLHHVYHAADKAVGNLSRVLKKGGIFINLEPTNNNYLLKKVRALIYKKNDIFDDTTEKAFETQELHELFLNHGLAIIDVLFPGLLAYVLWFNPDAFPLLNVGSLKAVSFLGNMEKFLWRSSFARYFSFATLTICRKN